MRKQPQWVFRYTVTRFGDGAYVGRSDVRSLAERIAQAYADHEDARATVWDSLEQRTCYVAVPGRRVA